MPHNRFPDSREKRELRRRDYRMISNMADVVGSKLDYCGLPSVEFLDVLCWSDRIKSVTSFENDPDSYQDMLIVRDSLEFPFRVSINPDGCDNILAYLSNESYSFSLYNIDLFGGMIYTVQSKTKNVKENKSTTAFQQLFAQQGRSRQSFVLITTFNVRDSGAKDYNEFMNSVRVGLKEKKGVEQNLRSHDQNQATRLSICFPYFCWTQAHALGFDHLLCETTVYRSNDSSTMVHFFQAFRFQGGALPAMAPVRKAIEIANMPLYEMLGQVRKKAVEFPLIQ